MTDGSVNASLPKTANPDDLTFAQAMDLLAARRDAAPAPKRGGFGRARPVKTTTVRKAAVRKKKTA